MLMRQIIHADHAPAALGPYSHAVSIGNFLFTSGQIGIVPENGTLVSAKVEDQTHQVFQNLKAVLAAAGLSLSHVVKTTVFLTDLKDFSAVNEIYGTYFPQMTYTHLTTNELTIIDKYEKERKRT